ncbi:hypothetical protein IL306_006481 [Fusarium sp. DS 682]|nr:hypothetical protein IL306_006481 [Fusarium sp. DS 682]
MNQKDAGDCTNLIRGPGLTGYLRAFAIVVHADRPRDIEDFIQERLSDDKFPLDDTNKQRAHEIMKRLGYSSRDRHLFNVNAASVSVKYFVLGNNDQAKHHEIAETQMLPWVLCKGGPRYDPEEKSGGYGDVRKYKIDRDSHDFSEPLRNVGLYSEFVAVKTMKQSYSEMRHPIKEFKMLTRFSGRDHRNIITLLATYIQDDRYHFVFPAAECDLQMYWKFHQGPLVNPATTDAKYLRWLSGQIRDLFAAMAKIHEGKKVDGDTEMMFGRHGDLKPENILWFKSRDKEYGLFVITDLGIADAHRDQSKSNVSGSKLPVTPGYRPPECNMLDGKISRAFDVWTLGCVLLEMSCWLLGGNENIDNFKKHRTSRFILGNRSNIFFDIIRPNTREGYTFQVKQSVMQWVDSLHNMTNCSAYVHDLLDLIIGDMLVVDKNKRESTANLLTKVQVMHGKVNQDIDYIKAPKAKPKAVESKSMTDVHLSQTLTDLLEGQKRN